MIKFVMLGLVLLISSRQEETIRDIGIAMKAGSAKELAVFLNKTVEMRIEGKSSNYSRNQAEAILRDFFTEYPVSDFTYTVNFKRGTSSESLKYTIGLYTHEKGAFRVVMLIKKIGEVYLIDTLNFAAE